jgi:hypothetical protein
LFNLNDFMPKRPGVDEVRAIMEMFEASVDGQLYDPDRWSKYYRPSGVQISAGSAASNDADEDTPAPVASKPAPVAAPAPQAQPEVASAPAPAAEGKPSVDDILKMIRSRQT